MAWLTHMTGALFPHPPGTSGWLFSDTLNTASVWRGREAEGVTQFSKGTTHSDLRPSPGRPGPGTSQ